MSGTSDRAAQRGHDRARTRAGQNSRGIAPPGRARYRRSLRREAPTVVGLLLTDEDFTVMTRYPSFPFDDYGRYLHHLDGLLHSLHSQGTPIEVTLFDPDGYADYCAATGQPPDSAATRTRYIAEFTAGRAAVPYSKQPLSALRVELARAADRRATWERATDALMDAGACPECGRNLAHCAFDAASHTLLRVIEAVGTGTHHVVCSVPTDGPPLLAAVYIDADADGQTRLAEADALVLCTVMAAGAVTVRPGGLVVRTTDADGTDTVRGWSLRDGEPHPLTEAEVFNAYCTDPATGQPVPPEPGLCYRAGLPLPPPLSGNGPAG
jgi:hypothetical protein